MRRLLKRNPQVRCERYREFFELQPRRVAVGVSHNDQKDLLRIALTAQGFDEVVVETANKLQGLEFDVVVAWHPLSGLPEPDGFHLDPGRLCVLEGAEAGTALTAKNAKRLKSPDTEQTS